MKKTRVLVLFDTDGDPPASQEYKKELEASEEAEFDVARALVGKGHEVRFLGFKNDLDQLTQGLRAMLEGNWCGEALWLPRQPC